MLLIENTDVFHFKNYVAKPNEILATLQSSICKKFIFATGINFLRMVSFFMSHFRFQGLEGFSGWTVLSRFLGLQNVFRQTFFALYFPLI